MTDVDRIDIVVVGSVALDTIETPVAKREDVLGGSVSYACSAASFFARPGMVGVVGSDFPDAHIDSYRNLGIDTRGLQQEEGRTFRWSGVYEEDMNNRRTLSTELNVFAGFKPGLPAEYRTSPYLFLANIAPDLQLHVLAEVENAEFILADTMDLWINTAHAELEQVMARVDMIALNDSEARLLTGEKNTISAARAVLKMGPRYVALKKGEHGALLFHEGGVLIVPAYPVEDVKDPTGAGDAFAGGFIGALACGRSKGPSAMAEAMLRGSVLASFAVEEFSLDRLKSLTRSEVDARLAEFRKIIV